MTKEELKAVATKVAEASSCYAGLKDLIVAWQKAIGTSGEKAAAEKMLAGLKECVTPIDGLIAFAGSPTGEQVFGKEGAASTLKAAQDAKANGEDTCICPACQNGKILLAHEKELLG
ncbi:heat-shock protein Hsp90 [Selenomonas sp.]|uniref:heat-shock protein Hsp90 n=1 Tax=Selenomonas sp. TaxID=2053611 RepID=UPI0025EFCEA9|nr:heat-shock protein Hsp90 [Selenomonas sp.]MCI6282863.1 heat-shock protein Hsp90 [Selenomonas sp.]